MVPLEMDLVAREAGICRHSLEATLVLHSLGSCGLLGGQRQLSILQNLPGKPENPGEAPGLFLL